MKAKRPNDVRHGQPQLLVQRPGWRAALGQGAQTNEGVQQVDLAGAGASCRLAPQAPDVRKDLAEVDVVLVARALAIAWPPSGAQCHLMDQKGLRRTSKLAPRTGRAAMLLARDCGGLRGLLPHGRREFEDLGIVGGIGQGPEGAAAGTATAGGTATQRSMS